MSNKLSIPIILGTARKDRESSKVAKFILNEVLSHGVESILIDVRDFMWGETIPSWASDSRSIKWKNIAESADGFIIILPEYNHGYPGELKILLDSSYKEYKRKPVGLCGVSSGVFGGARAVELIKPVLVELKMVPIFETLYFPKVSTFFKADADGLPNDEACKNRVIRFLDELTWFAETLKNGKK